jgi:predicted Zn-dependent protease
MNRKIAFALVALLTSAPAFAQLGQLDKLRKRADQAQKAVDLDMPDADERALGEEVSGKIRQEFGVYQNAAVTKYVSLVGTVLAKASSRPALNWQFIVLDTDGVNAFAAPGGIVHITRGALGMIKSEAELAGVLGHEISHVTRKHTVKAIRKGNIVKAGTEQLPGSEAFTRIANAAYDNIIENKYDRGDEEDADREGVRLANKAGYSPSGLSAFLGKLMERNKGNTTRNALFASHPETQGRIDRITAQIAAEKLTAAATVAPRYTSRIAFDATPISQIATTSAAGAKGVAGGGTAAPAPGSEKKEEKPAPKKKGFSLGGLSLSKGKQAESTQASASAGGRAVGSPDRNAKGGPNPEIVGVTISASELAAFKKGIA